MPTHEIHNLAEMYTLMSMSPTGKHDHYDPQLESRDQTYSGIVLLIKHIVLFALVNSERCHRFINNSDPAGPDVTSTSFKKPLVFAFYPLGLSLSVHD